MDDKKWIEELASAKKAERQRAALESEKALSDRKLAQCGADEMWARLLAALRAGVDELARAMDGAPALALIGDGRRRVVLKADGVDAELYVFVFHPEMLELCATNGNYRLDVLGASELVWILEGESTPTSTDALVRMAIETAFRKAQ